MRYCCIDRIVYRFNASVSSAVFDLCRSAELTRFRSAKVTHYLETRTDGLLAMWAMVVVVFVFQVDRWRATDNQCWISRRNSNPSNVSTIFPNCRKFSSWPSMTKATVSSE